MIPMDDTDPTTPAEAEHAEAMAAADAHYNDALPAPTGDPIPWACPHPVDQMGTVFAHPTGHARRVCTACWHDFGPLSAAELSAGVAQYPRIAEPVDATDAAVRGRAVVAFFAANPDAVLTHMGEPVNREVVAPLLALIEHLDYQTMILRNRVESIRRAEEDTHQRIAGIVAQRDQAEDDVLDLLGIIGTSSVPEHRAMRARYERQHAPAGDIAGTRTSRFR
jgi:hypothetical protein